MPDQVTNVLTLSAATTTGTGSLVNLRTDPSGGPRLPNTMELGDLRFYLNVTTLTGTSPDWTFNVIATINGADHTLGSITNITATGTYNVEITNCPSDIKIGYTLNSGTTTNLTCKVDCPFIYGR